MSNSTFQQATHNSPVNFNIPHKHLEELDHISAQLRVLIENIDLSVDIQQELLSEIQTIEA
ncbi:MAG: hypothetical protein JWN76_1866 [Chitinophagaceae bacterium]|nr:hypothetical protein [Chitinophagaceae bacterium]